MYIVKLWSTTLVVNFVLRLQINQHVYKMSFAKHTEILLKLHVLWMDFLNLDSSIYQYKNTG